MVPSESRSLRSQVGRKRRVSFFVLFAARKPGDRLAEVIRVDRLISREHVSVLPLRELAAIRAKSENYGFTAVGYFIYLFKVSPSLGRLTFQMPDTAQSHSSVVALGKLRSVAAPHE